MKRIQWEQKYITPSGGYARAYIQSTLFYIYSSVIKNSVVVLWRWSLLLDNQQEVSGECDTFELAEQAIIAAWDAYLSALVAEAAKVIVEVEG